MIKRTKKRECHAGMTMLAAMFLLPRGTERTLVSKSKITIDRVVTRSLLEQIWKRDDRVVSYISRFKNFLPQKPSRRRRETRFYLCVTRSLAPAAKTSCCPRTCGYFT